MKSSNHENVTGLSISFIFLSFVIWFFHIILEIFKNSNDFLTPYRNIVVGKMQMNFMNVYMEIL